MMVIVDIRDSSVIGYARTIEQFDKITNECRKCGIPIDTIPVYRWPYLWFGK